MDNVEAAFSPTCATYIHVRFRFPCAARHDVLGSTPCQQISDVLLGRWLWLNCGVVLLCSVTPSSAAAREVAHGEGDQCRGMLNSETS